MSAQMQLPLARRRAQRALPDGQGTETVWPDATRRPGHRWGFRVRYARQA